MKKINIKVKYPRKEWEEIERKSELRIKLRIYNKFSCDIVDVETVKPVTETEIRILRKLRRDRLYYLKNKKTIHRNKLKYYWRKRLGTATALNEPFEGCQGHHITRDFVVYIPVELHRSIKHSLKEESPYDMVEINKAVIHYLYAGKEYATMALVKEHLASTQ